MTERVYVYERPGSKWALMRSTGGDLRKWLKERQFVTGASKVDKGLTINKTYLPDAIALMETAYSVTLSDGWPTDSPMPKHTSDSLLAEAAGLAKSEQVQRFMAIVQMLGAGRAWEAQGFASLGEMLDDKIGFRLSLPKPVRKAAAAQLTASGLTQRDTANALGVTDRTLRRDLSERTNVRMEAPILSGVTADTPQADLSPVGVAAVFSHQATLERPPAPSVAPASCPSCHAVSEMMREMRDAGWINENILQAVLGLTGES